MFKEIFHIHCPYSEVITQVVSLLPLGVDIDEYLVDVSDYTLSGFHIGRLYTVHWLMLTKSVLLRK